MRVFIVIVVICFIPFLGNGQNFHKIYPFNDTIAIAHDIYVTDSCYYIGGTAAVGAAFCDVVLTKIDLNGNQLWLSKKVTPESYDLAYGGNTQLDTNFRGNFIHGYTNRITNVGWYPNLTEMNGLGDTIMHIDYDLFKPDSLEFFDSGRFVVHNDDSSYFGFFTYYDYTTDSNPSVGLDGETGCLLFKVNYLGDTLWTKKFHHPSTSFGKPLYGVRDLDFLNDGNILLTFIEYQQAGQDENEWVKIHFIITDPEGNKLSEEVFFDTQHCFSGFETLPLPDGGVLFSYFESQLNNNGQIYYFQHRPVIARLDQNFLLVWKDSLVPVFANLAYYGSPFQLRLINDTVFGGAHTWYDIDWDTYKQDMAVRVFNRNINGNVLWNRNYHFFPLDDSLNAPEYKLKDFELTPDGGFIMCGDVKNFDSLATGGQGQYAYVLKVNCLGFLGGPEASASYTFDENLAVTFNNSSIQAGAYTWIFGDNDTLQTSEYIDTVSHTYPMSGGYAVQLIAHGCNDAADTLHFTIVVPEEPNDSLIMVGDGTLLTLYPNPLASGESLAFYVDNLPNEEVVFELINEQGQLVFSGIISQDQTTYIVPIQIASGMYFASLRTNDKRLEVEKLIVK